jgi:hypothetical protein
MPPKDASKKTVQKQKQKVIEDKTFGLKNKNKSKKVQQHIQSVEKNVLNSGDPKTRKLEEQRRQAKAEAKNRKKALKDEQEALFGEALLAVSKKSAIDSKEGKVEAAGRDANDDNTKKSTSRAMKMMFQMDAQEMSDKLREDVRCTLDVERYRMLGRCMSYHFTHVDHIALLLADFDVCSQIMCRRWKMRLKSSARERWRN